MQNVFTTDIYGVAIYYLVNFWRVFHNVAYGGMGNQHSVVDFNSICASVFELYVLVISARMHYEVVFHASRIGGIAYVDVVVYADVFNFAEFAYMRSPFRFVAADEIVAVVGCSIGRGYFLRLFRIFEGNLVSMSATNSVFVMPFVLIVCVGVVPHLDVGNVESEAILLDEQRTVV